jgi:hypothetical protein
MDTSDHSLWSHNHPRLFWQCQPDFPDDIWENAIAQALPLLGLTITRGDIDTVLAMTLGEGRFGQDHWTFSLPKKIYYLLKPVIPRILTRALRRVYHRSEKENPNIQWLIEPRYANFLQGVMANLLLAAPEKKIMSSRCGLGTFNTPWY